MLIACTQYIRVGTMLFKGQDLLWVATFKQLFRLLRGETPAVGGTPLASNWNNPLANRIPADTHTLYMARPPLNPVLQRFAYISYSAICSMPFGFCKSYCLYPLHFQRYQLWGLGAGMTVLLWWPLVQVPSLSLHNEDMEQPARYSQCQFSGLWGLKLSTMARSVILVRLRVGKNFQKGELRLGLLSGGGGTHL